MKRPLILVLTLIGALAPTALVFSQAVSSSAIPGSTPHVYKTIGDVDLKLYLFEPDGAGPHPSIVFFFGGGWRSGTPSQFAPHARYLRVRGMAVALADYRVSTRHRTSPLDATRDAKSAVRWLRAHAEDLGLDPTRIAAGGGSAGGHLAAATAVVPGLDEPDEEQSVSSRPVALVLFNPALDLSQLPPRFGLNPEERLSISPQQHVRADLAPAIVFHGTADTTVPHASAVAFRDAMKAAGNRAELVSYEGRAHGFFNYGRGAGEEKEGRDFLHSLERADRFLTELGFLDGEPSVREFTFDSSSRDD